VAREYQLGQNLGVKGTPAIVTDGGDFISGYMPPHELLQSLKELQAADRESEAGGARTAGR
jgi:thiol:disulfide interchange protein DsbC